MQLSKNLTLEEFTRSATAKARGIDNSMHPLLVPHAVEYAERCFQKVRAIWGGVPRTLNSGYRCKALNAAVGGSATSQHMLANAGDYPARPGESIYALFIKLLESGLIYDQLLIEGASPADPRKGWLHIAYNTFNMRGLMTSGLADRPEQRMEIKAVHFGQGGKPSYYAIDRYSAIDWAKRQGGLR